MKRDHDSFLMDYLYDELEPSDRAAFERRMAEEPELQQEVASLSGTRALVERAAAAAPLPEPPRALYYDLLRAARHEVAPLAARASVWERLGRFVMRPSTATVMLALVVTVTGVYIVRKEDENLRRDMSEVTSPTALPSREETRVATGGQPPPAIAPTPSPFGLATDGRDQGARRPEEAAASPSPESSLGPDKPVKQAAVSGEAAPDPATKQTTRDPAPEAAPRPTVPAAVPASADRTLEAPSAADAARPGPKKTRALAAAGGKDGGRPESVADQKAGDEARTQRLKRPSPGHAAAPVVARKGGATRGAYGAKPKAVARPPVGGLARLATRIKGKTGQPEATPAKQRRRPEGQTKIAPRVVNVRTPGDAPVAKSPQPKAPQPKAPPTERDRVTITPVKKGDPASLPQRVQPARGRPGPAVVKRGDPRTGRGIDGRTGRYRQPVQPESPAREPVGLRSPAPRVAPRPPPSAPPVPQTRTVNERPAPSSPPGRLDTLKKEKEKKKDEEVRKPAPQGPLAEKGAGRPVPPAKTTVDDADTRRNRDGVAPKPTDMPAPDRVADNNKKVAPGEQDKWSRGGKGDYAQALDHYRNRRYQLAIRGFRRYLDGRNTNGEAAEARLNLARSYRATRKVRDAVAQYRELLARYPQYRFRTAVLIETARLEIQLGDLASARAHLETAARAPDKKGADAARALLAQVQKLEQEVARRRAKETREAEKPDLVRKRAARKAAKTDVSRKKAAKPAKAGKAGAMEPAKTVK